MVGSGGLEAMFHPRGEEGATKLKTISHVSADVANKKSCCVPSKFENKKYIKMHRCGVRSQALDSAWRDEADLAVILAFLGLLGPEFDDFQRSPSEHLELVVFCQAIKQMRSQASDLNSHRTRRYGATGLTPRSSCICRALLLGQARGVLVQSAWEPSGGQVCALMRSIMGSPGSGPRARLRVHELTPPPTLPKITPSAT